MSTILRRGPSSLARFLSFNTNSTCARSLRRGGFQRLQILAYQQSLLKRTFTTSIRQLQSAAAQAVARESDEDTTPDNSAVNNGPVSRFEDLGSHNLVNQVVVDTITQKMRLETMTEVQKLTINESLKGKDLVAQARTGTGKTLAFLIPIVQNILKNDPSLAKRSGLGRRYGSSGDIRALIISPTRELAEQIAQEALKVTANTSCIVQTAVGGNSKRRGLQLIQNQGCHILVGTPGRLLDIFSDRESGVEAPNLTCLVLDEADRLLDQGFLPDIEEIQRYLPNRKEVDRQTLLYSATMPREMMKVIRGTMKPDAQFIRTFKEGELQAHERVAQKAVSLRGFENSIPTLVELCKREVANKSDRPFKAIVFCAATSESSLVAAALNRLRVSGDGRRANPLHPAEIIEIHSRLSQQRRTEAAMAFKRSKSAILVASDVVARGMDFPDVTHVIQMGVPPNEEQYVHRLGRTARADKSGEGWILLTETEMRVARHRLRTMPLKMDRTLEIASVDMKTENSLAPEISETLQEVMEACKRVPDKLKIAAYGANIGVLTQALSKQDALDMLHDRAIYGLSMETTPPVNPGLAAKLGLRGLRNINIGFAEEDDTSDSRDFNSRPRDRFGAGSRYRDQNEGGSYGSRDREYGRQRSGGAFDRFDRSRGDRGDRGDRGGSGGYGRGSRSGFSDRDRGRRDSWAE